jgi:putative membrane protein
MIGFGSGLTSEEREMVLDAIRRAELRTSAEIVVVIDRAAGSWRSWALAVALLLAMIVPWPLIELTQLGTRTIFLTQLLAAAALVVAFFPQAARLRLVPRMLRRRKAHEAALREFAARGMTATRDRTGLMIYVALAERYAEIVTDTGISAAIEDSHWRGLIDRLIASIEAERLAHGLADIVTGAADSLATRFPPSPDDRDELASKVVVI